MKRIRHLFKNWKTKIFKSINPYGINCTRTINNKKYNYEMNEKIALSIIYFMNSSNFKRIFYLLNFNAFPKSQNLRSWNSENYLFDRYANHWCILNVKSKRNSKFSIIIRKAEVSRANIDAFVQIVSNIHPLRNPIPEKFVESSISSLYASGPL